VTSAVELKVLADRVRALEAGEASEGTRYVVKGTGVGAAYIAVFCPHQDERAVDGELLEVQPTSAMTSNHRDVQQWWFNAKVEPNDPVQHVEVTATAICVSLTPTPPE